MRRLIDIVCEPDLVCIDEVVLEDPGNITMLATLLQHMVAAGANVLATANMPPKDAGGEGGWIRSFERELGAIAAVFEICRIEGQDWRTAGSDDEGDSTNGNDSVLHTSWSELEDYLLQTHPMHDAGWLSQIGRIAITTPVQALSDKDTALRFIRFIDRVYDRNVQLVTTGSKPLPHDLVAPLAGDKRYVWHLARGTSRLTQLLRVTEPAALRSESCGGGR
jgi:cell division protein ZapE